jgi:hypothetical protein
MKKKIITAVVVIIILTGMVLAANYLVHSFDILELLKKFHGG